jgi:hypothetical protein
MPLTQTERARYARHLLLPELAEPGQERLLAARVRFDASADSEAAAVAEAYLLRAGVAVEADANAPDGLRVDIGDAARCAALAGRVELLEAARALAGAFAAVEAIKALAGFGSAGSLSPELSLLSEEA